MRIFVDMDGVLTDFVGGVCNMLGIHQTKLMHHWRREHAGEYDIVPHIPAFATPNRLKRILGEDWEANWGKTPFWKMVESEGERFWYNLDLIHRADGLWRICECLADEGAFISTSPAIGGASPQGKANWLQKNLGVGPKNYMMGSSKHLLAHPRAILIDDTDKHVDAFRANGGLAVLVPCVWNSQHEHADHSHDWTVAELGKLIGEHGERLHGNA